MYLFKVWYKDVKYMFHFVADNSITFILDVKSFFLNIKMFMVLSKHLLIDA